MKILSVRAKNIASLKGEIFVDFSQRHFTDVGLFAITGKTGAGKTSLLDAITAGLYGYTPRCSKNTPEDIMSKFTGEAWSEVEFEVKNNKYRCRWGIHRSRKQFDGALQPPKMELVDLSNGNILEEKLTEVRNKVEEITGLDYEKFLQTVMLSQGEFAKFLKANSKEKSALLEKITGSTIYSDLSQRAHLKEKEEREKLHVLKNEIDEDKLLSSEQKEEVQKQIEEGTKKHQILNSEEETVNKQIVWLEQVSQKRKELENANQRAIKAKEAYEQLAPELQKLELHQKTIPFQAELGQLFNLIADADGAKKELAQITSTLPVLLEKKEHAAEHLETAKQALKTAENRQKENLPKIRQAAGLEAQRDQLREKFKTTERKISESRSIIADRQKGLQKCSKLLSRLSVEKDNCLAYINQYHSDESLIKDYSAIETNLRNYNALLSDLDSHYASKEKYQLNKNKVEQDLEQQAGNLKEIETSLKNFIEAGAAEDEKLHKLLHGKNIQSIRNNQEQLIRIKPLFENKKRIHLNFKQNKEKQHKLKTEISALEAIIVVEKEKSEALCIELGRQKELLLTYEALYDKEVIIQSLVDHRAGLKEGEPCPLCGAIEHPYADYNSDKNTNEAKQKRDSQEKLVKDLNDQIKELQKKESVQVNNVDHYKTTLAELQQHEADLLQDFNELCTETKQQLDILDFKSIEEKTLNVENEINSNRSILIEYEKLQQHKEELTKALQNQKDLRETTNHLLQEKRSELALIHSNLEQLEAQLTKYSSNKTLISNGLSQILVKYDLFMPEPKDVEPWLDYIRIRADKYASTLTRVNKLDVDIQAAKADIRVLDEAILSENKVVDETIKEQGQIKQEGLSLAKQIEGLIGNQKSVEFEKELNDLLENCSKEKDKADKAYREAENVYVEKLTQEKSARALFFNRNSQLENLRQFLEEKAVKSGFEGITSLQSAVLQAEEEQSIRKRKDLIEKSLIEINSEIATKEKEINALQEKHLTENSMEELQAQKAVLIQEKESIATRLAELRHQLKVNDELTVKFGKIRKQIEKQEKEYSKWAMLNDIIGSSKGDEFREFAQGLTLSHLLVQANRQLIKLNDRYLLQKVEGKDLDLEIIDRHQADVTRPIHTLSGGETFLVSLALALGLCELAGKNLKIDTLFIDEGFGTLDSETLETAISTLENLKASGKLVGVISHVDTLKERITTQVQIIKTPGGISEIVLKS